MIVFLREKQKTHFDHKVTVLISVQVQAPQRQETQKQKLANKSTDQPSNHLFLNTESQRKREKIPAIILV